MATTIRTIEYPDGEIFISAYDGADGVAIIRASGGHHSVSLELDRTEVQQLISALSDILATFPADEPETPGPKFAVGDSVLITEEPFSPVTIAAVTPYRNDISGWLYDVIDQTNGRKYGYYENEMTADPEVGA